MVLEQWDDKISPNFVLKIADLSVAIFNSNPQLNIVADTASELFLIDRDSNSSFDVRLQMEILTEEVLKQDFGQIIFDSQASWQLTEQGELRHFIFRSPLYGNLPYKIATFNHSFSQGKLFFNREIYHQERLIDPLEYPLGELLFTNLLAQGYGVEVHAAGIADLNGNGYLFTGQSEAGKTTTARKWHRDAQVTILSDDRIIIREIDGQFYIFGTPWHGEAEFAAPKNAPLKNIFFLKQGDGLALQTIKPSEATTQLFACSFLPFYNPLALLFTLDFYEKLVNSISCQNIIVALDSDIVSFVRQLEPVVKS